MTGTRGDRSRVRENFKDQGAAFDRKAELDSESVGLNSERTLKKTYLSPEQISDVEAAVKAAPGHSFARITAHYLQVEIQARAFGWKVIEWGGHRG